MVIIFEEVREDVVGGKTGKQEFKMRHLVREARNWVSVQI